jgi:hypothetical protein
LGRPCARRRACSIWVILNIRAYVIERSGDGDCEARLFTLRVVQCNVGWDAIGARVCFVVVVGGAAGVGLSLLGVGAGAAWCSGTYNVRLGPSAFVASSVAYRHDGSYTTTKP